MTSVALMLRCSWRPYATNGFKQQRDSFCFLSLGYISRKSLVLSWEDGWLVFPQLMWISSRRNIRSLTFHYNDLRTLIEFESSRDVQFVIKREVSEIEQVHSTTIVERNSNVSRFIHVWIICKLMDHISALMGLTDANTFVDKGFPPPFLNQFTTDFKSL